MEEQEVQNQTQPEENQPEAAETPTEQEALENSKNPQRTGQYIEKLKEEKQQIAQQYENLLDSITPKHVPQPSVEQFQNLNQEQIDDVYSSMVDKEGYLDGNKLLQTLKELDAKAKEAEARAKRVEEHLQRREVAESEKSKTEIMDKVHQMYPQLDPENKEGFDTEFYEAVRNEILGQMVLKGTQDPLQAANKWASKFVSNSQPQEQVDMTKEEEKTKEEKEQAKAQINATRPRSASMAGYYSNSEDEALREKIISGKKGALAEMLRRHEAKNK